MTSRSAGYIDVRVNGQVVGFVTGPDAKGKWHAYKDQAKGNSKRVASVGTKDAAVQAVKDS